jgi:hypothetical protein
MDRVILRGLHETVLHLSSLLRSPQDNAEERGDKVTRNERTSSERQKRDKILATLPYLTSFFTGLKGKR